MMFVQTSSEILNAMDSNSLSSGLVVTDACGAKNGKFVTSVTNSESVIRK